MRPRIAAFLVALWIPAAFCQDAPAPATTSAVMLESVTVSGEQPGPGLWKVTKDGHVMWILGTYGPLPARMQWQSKEVSDAVAGSQVVLGSPSMSIKPKTNFFGKMFLLPSLIHVRNLPEGATLKDAVPAADYALWLTLKQKYIGRDSSVESYRPLFAAFELYGDAIKSIGLKQMSGVEKSVTQMAKDRNVPVQPVRYTVEVEEPRKVIKAFKAADLEDAACFHQTLENVDKRLNTLTERANAWATGDVPALSAMLAQDRWETCLNAVGEAGVAKQLGLNDVVGRLESTWLDAVTTAMSTHKQTFAMVPMSLLVRPHGPLEKLAQRGYTVTAPDDVEDSP
ncbi:uncharacterized protein YbaP (TraB family) [Luteibacter sp. Sphag1AF]|uniref:TraB/GumN family protein n=1 Tax=Luteibacter sp. Sphag1AF TaxID=2587031 RepID=UPI00160944E0|nr:TraB/GumN family protein [Luteibacter sp. Sphag1AF]MBB3228652.1 uncharacterized protein YbaP (TraB family) [Luteibacter sp. Sphag1AF]